MKKWTDKDKIFLIKYFNSMSNLELAKHLGTTEQAIKNILFRLSLKRQKKLKVDKKPEQVQVMCKPIKVPTCAPQVVMHNGKPLYYWGKNLEKFKQRLSK